MLGFYRAPGYSDQWSYSCVFIQELFVDIWKVWKMIYQTRTLNELEKKFVIWKENEKNLEHIFL